MSKFRSRSVFATVAALALSTVGVVVIGGGVARADTTTTTQSFTAPGTYTVTIPPGTNTMTLDALGAAGFPGDDSATQFSTGGSAGSGVHVQQSATVYNLTGGVASGDTLEVVVGAKGGGGQRGYGDELSGSGGNGGGASYVLDLTTNTLLLVAGGGGGGGGGGGTFAQYDGGHGGTGGNGGPGLGTFGGNAGGAGAVGQPGVCGSSGLSSGTPGESAPTASAVAGGGGGGGGACGGSGGGSGDHGAGAGGGGGGGAGASLGTGATFGKGTNTGDGNASLTFISSVPQAPLITSPNCMYADNFEIPGGIGQRLTASGYPAPSFQLLNQPSWLSINSPTLTPDGASAGLFLDAAAGASINDAPQYQFQVQATNSQGSTIEALTLDTASGHPVFLTAPESTATAGSPFTFAVRAVGCPPIVSYSLTGIDTATSKWLAINATTGQLSGTPTAADIGTHTFTVEADTGVAGITPLTQSFSLQVDPGPLTVTAGPLPAATVGTPYTAGLAATGGTAPYRWTVASGSSLPAGLSLHPDGTIDGTPTATGLGTFTATVTDSAAPAHVASRQLNIQVNPAPLTITTTSPLPQGTVGSRYAVTLAAAGGTTPYSWTLAAGSNLPAGLTLHPDGTIDGTPTAPSTTSIGLTVTDSASSPLSTSTSLYLAIQPKPVAAVGVLPPDLPTGQVGQNYTGQLHAFGGSGTLSWALAQGSTLPAGLSLSPAGAITGTPTTAGSTPDTFIVSDSGGPATATATYTLTVDPAPLTITTTSPLAAATVGNPYTATLAATGGTAPYRWTLASGSSLPAGLTLHTDGTITGTPTKTQSGTFTAQVTDAANPARTATQQLTLQIKPAQPKADLTVSNSHLGTFVTGGYGWYRLTITNTGTAATTAPTTVSESLPAGLSYVIAYGSGWSCRHAGSTGSCTRTAALAASTSSSITVLVRITARVGTTLTTTATVTPTDPTPGDNTSTDRVTVRRS